jgi:hypothetical protein
MSRAAQGPMVMRARKSCEASSVSEYWTPGAWHEFGTRSETQAVPEQVQKQESLIGTVRIERQTYEEGLEPGLDDGEVLG